ncbi:hypothetical protein Sste5346_006570 [Sporothrix stenoceras]|uniref:Uncharacterized protein n=1 Tax=Sporothrix stenoceras TaxID=5173 RepID=A0ABR3YXQ9_9PEZI
MFMLTSPSTTTRTTTSDQNQALTVRNGLTAELQADELRKNGNGLALASIANTDDTNDNTESETVAPVVLVRLPNGVPLAPHYQRLLDYFARDVLASLSVHPAIHHDLAQGLVPAMLHEPHLLSAGLALSAAGLASRGLSDIGGIGLPRVIEHLQISGLALLRQAVESRRQQGGDNLVATCLLWCLADVFAADASASSWRIHLQGIQALLGGVRALDAFVARGRTVSSSSASTSRSAMGHLSQLYLSLQTLPHVARCRNEAMADRTIEEENDDNDKEDEGETDDRIGPTPVEPNTATATAMPGPRIDGFLGCSVELFDILQQVEQLASTMPAIDVENKDEDVDVDYDDEFDDDNILAAPHLKGPARVTAETLLARALVQALEPKEVHTITTSSTASSSSTATTTTATPVIHHIPAPALTPAAAREFAFCHGCFQQATLIHVYRRLFRLPSCAALIQRAVCAIRRMAGQMTQGAPCSAWVAMALPLFTAGCEAFLPTSQAWAHAALDSFAASIGSRHVQLLRRALEDVWRLRARLGDVDGRLCAEALLDELNYNIILF